jgi:hypothetical protein
VEHSADEMMTVAAARELAETADAVVPVPEIFNYWLQGERPRVDIHLQGERPTAFLDD